MTPHQARSMYRRQIAKHGGPVTLKRGAGGPGLEATFKARVTGYDPQEQNGDVQQGDSKVIFMAEDLGAFPVPLESQGRDAIFINGAKRTIRAIDDKTRAIAGVLIAYELRVRG